MKNGSKKGAKIKLKSIKKRRPKIDAKRVRKRALPPGGREPPRRFPSKKGTVQKNNKQTKKATLRSCGARKGSRARNRTPTRLGRLRAGADLSCLRQCTRSGPWKIVCLAKVRVHTVICSGFAGSGAKQKFNFLKNTRKRNVLSHFRQKCWERHPK